VDQRVEPPSWLPDGAASSDTKGPISHDSVADDPDSDSLDSESLDSDGLDSQGPGTQSPGSQGPLTFGPAGHEPISYDPASHDYDPVGHDPVSHDPVSYGSAGSRFGATGSGIQSSAGDPSGPDAVADANAYSYGGDTSHQNGQDTAFGQEGAPTSAYRQESHLAGGGVGSPPPYPAQVGEAAAVTDQTSAPRRRTAFSAAPRKTRAPARRADLVLARLEPWSVMKFSFLISLVAWVILFVAVAVLWFALDSLGVFTSVQKTLESVTSSSGSAGVSLAKWFSASRILGYTMLIGAVNIVLITALSTLGAMIYNLVTHLGGGIEVTLRESD
jgi:hypothetical protein